MATTTTDLLKKVNAGMTTTENALNNKLLYAVYEVAATAVLNALQSSTITKFSTNQTTRTKEIGVAISGSL